MKSEFSFAETGKEGHFARVKSARPAIRRRKPSPRSSGWSVVPIDGTTIRRKVRRDYEKVIREVDAAKAETERFETEDKPQFDKWMSANFGAVLTELRDLQQKLFQAQELVNEVQQEFYYGNYRSIGNAYKKVMHRRDHPEEMPADPKDAEETEEQAFRRMFEEQFGKIEDEFWEKLGVGQEQAKPARQPERTGGNRLKDVYRQLVRRLHPDKGGKRSAREIEWWHQTQDAYETGNVEQLELILTLVEVGDKGSKDATASVLVQLTLEFKKSLRALKKKIRDLKQDAAWNFSRLTDLTALLERVRLQIQNDREQVVGLLEKYEKQIQTWAAASTVAASAAPKKRARARRGAWQEEEWF